MAEDEQLDVEQLGVVGDLCNEMLGLDEQIAFAEEQVKELKAERRKISEIHIPDKMMEFGLSKVTLSGGVSLEVKQYYSAKIPDVRQEEAFAWLKANKLDAIIKSKVDCSFGQGEEETRNEEALCGYLDRMRAAYKRKRSVHASTLKAFVREQVEGGADFPQDLFGVYIGNMTKIERR